VKPEKKHHWEDLEINAEITLTDIKEIWRQRVEWIHLKQNRLQWQAFVNMVMNFYGVASQEISAFYGTR
jgi:hypothetical protein